MGFFFEFDAVNNVARCSIEGQVIYEILVEAGSAAGRMLASRPPCKSILDFSGVASFDVSNETIRNLALLPPVFGAETVGVIVAPKPVTFGLSRMFSIIGEQARPNLHVVHTMDEAYESLGITSPQFSRVEIN